MENGSSDVVAVAEDGYTHLILHKVRGKAAFDIAHLIRCPICEPIRQGLDYGNDYAGACNECDDDGFWWIVTTSGHRAYPYWTMPIGHILDLLVDWLPLPDLPADIPDHYQITEAPSLDISDLLHQVRQANAGPIDRRGL